MKDYLRLIRWKNLLMLALVTAALYWGLFYVMLRFGVHLSDTAILTQMHFARNFTLLLLCVLCIAGGGYVVNDYFDTRIDEINRPGKVIVGHTKTRAQAARCFQLLWGIGIVLGLLLSASLHSLTTGLIIVGAAGFLWFYSSSYKRQFLIGNLVVALCVFLAVYLPGQVVVESLRLQFACMGTDGIYEDFATLLNTLVHLIHGFSAGIGLFAALLTLLREITKDLQDRKGDAEMECRTLPIVWGEKGAKWTLTLLAAAIIALGFYFAWFVVSFPRDNLTRTLYIFCLLLPLTAYIALLWRSGKPREYAQLSALLKYTMLIDSLYPLAAGYLYYMNML